MSVFSDSLTQLIKKYNISIKKAAAMCNINYTLLSRYTSGDRFPTNPSVIENICNSLNFSPKEQTEIFNLYFEEKYGTEHWNAFQQIDSLLEKIDSIFDTQRHKFPSAVYEMPEKLQSNFIPLTNPQEIFDAISYAIITCSDSERIPIYSILQPNPNLIDLIINNPMSEKIDLEQIICIDKNTPNSPTINLQLLEHILPLAKSDINSTISYYYGSTSNSINEFNIYPFLIIIGDFVIRTNCFITIGELISAKELVDFYKDKFRQIQKDTLPLTNKFSSEIDITSYYVENEPADAVGYGIHSWPCIGTYLSKDILENNILSDIPCRQQMIEMLAQTYSYQEDTPNNLNTFVSKEGLIDFLNTGRFAEFPSKYYTPLSYEERVLILRRIATTARKNYTKIYLAKDEFKLPQKIGINFFPDYLCIKNTATPNIDALIISEASLSNIFTLYMDYCIDTKKVFTIPETVEYIESLIGKED